MLKFSFFMFDLFASVSSVNYFFCVMHNNITLMQYSATVPRQCWTTCYHCIHWPHITVLRYCDENFRTHQFHPPHSHETHSLVVTFCELQCGIWSQKTSISGLQKKMKTTCSYIHSSWDDTVMCRRDRWRHRQLTCNSKAAATLLCVKICLHLLKLL